MVFRRIVLTCRPYFSEYAPTALRNKWKPAATIKLIHYRRLGAKPHESSASGGYLGIQCLQRFQSLDATRNWDYIPGEANRAPPGVNRRASPCPSEVTRPSNSPPKSSLVGHFLLAHFCTLI